MALGIPWILGHRVYRNQQGKQAPPLGGVPESTEQISLVSYAERLDSVSLKFIDGSKRICDLLAGKIDHQKSFHYKSA